MEKFPSEQDRPSPSGTPAEIHLASDGDANDAGTAPPAEQTPPVSPGPEFDVGPGQGPSPSLSSNGSFTYQPRAFEDHNAHTSNENRPNSGSQFASPPHSSFLGQCDIPRSAPSAHSYTHFRPGLMVDELTALRDLSSNSSFNPPGPGRYHAIASPLFDQSVFSDPADFSNDVFLPGSAYEALHTALRNHQLSTTRSGIPSCRGSADSGPGVSISGLLNETSSPRRVDDAWNRPRAERYFQLSPERENVLWQNYLNEICLWVCKACISK